MYTATYSMNFRRSTFSNNFSELSERELEITKVSAYTSFRVCM